MTKAKKIRVAILFGGKSAEHEVSLQSAKNVYEAIDKQKYDVTLIGITKEGQWQLQKSSHYLLHSQNPKLIALNKSTDPIALVTKHNSPALLNLSGKNVTEKPDVVFPVLHGTFGEDGTIQGLLKLMDMPFVGASVLGSAIGMDKYVQKRLLRDAGLPIAKFLVYHAVNDVDFDQVAEQLGLPVFVKPANLGSSVGVSKVESRDQFTKAVTDAFHYDNKILVEQNINGVEVECAILGNENPIASLPGKIIPQHDFYSYQAKYVDKDGAVMEIPAKLPKETVCKIQELAIQAFQTLACEGMARVDCFLTDDNKLFINEINTIPGFTKISMYPKLWQVTGISYTNLIDRLIALAIERHTRDRKLQTLYT